MNQAIVLFAHGSRDCLWHQPLLQVAQRLRGMAPDVEVRCAYFELTSPDLNSTVHELVAMGLLKVRVVPMFSGVGKHAREDLPLLVQALRAQRPQLQLELQPAVGEDQRMIERLALIALDKL
jgi:sirohydrochlorin cobaltochelatase